MASWYALETVAVPNVSPIASDVVSADSINELYLHAGVVGRRIHRGLITSGAGGGDEAEGAG